MQSVSSGANEKIKSIHGIEMGELLTKAHLPCKTTLKCHGVGPQTTEYALHSPHVNKQYMVITNTDTQDLASEEVIICLQ